MKILNLYAGIGGNRKLWGNEHDITSIEINPDIAKIYQDFYPNDKVIVTDAHEYLLHHFKEYDFIWASPPCQTHSRCNYFLHAQGHIRYPDMKLWQEIIFLKTFYYGKFIIENVKSYYNPLIKPTVILGRHYIWSNFYIYPKEFKKKQIGTFNRKTASQAFANLSINQLCKRYNIDYEKYKSHNKLRDRQILRNMVDSEIGKYILECSQLKQGGLFNEQ